MSWNGEYVSKKAEVLKPTREQIEALSDEDAVYMAECFGVEVGGDVRLALISFFLK
ncbi:hypothetical protein VPHPG9A1_0014 [Vibrio phage PG9A-1]